MHEQNDHQKPGTQAAVHDSEQHASDVKVYEIEFKGSRRDFFLCPDRIKVKPLDFLIVQADRGEHIGRFIRFSDKDQFESTKEMKSILRRATYTDIQIMIILKNYCRFKSSESHMAAGYNITFGPLP